MGRNPARAMPDQLADLQIRREGNDMADGSSEQLRTVEVVIR
jgi:hypothetical protein